MKGRNDGIDKHLPPGLRTSGSRISPGEFRMVPIREFLHTLVANLGKAFQWDDNMNHAVDDVIGHATQLITCFQETLPFEVVFDGDWAEQGLSGIRQEISDCRSFSTPEEDACLYHRFDPSWIHSFRSLTEPGPDIAAIMAEYLMTWEIRSKDEEADYRPPAYRGCLVNGVPMVRSVALTNGTPPR